MLRILELQVTYGDHQVIKGVDISISRGESLGVVGESGAGKTTLALSLMGLGSGVARGRVVFKGQELLPFRADMMKELRWNHISMVFQNTAQALNPVIPVVHQIIEPMLEHKVYGPEEARERTRELLEQVGLSWERAHSYPHQLSGGERQLAIIAMSLSNNPDLLILDEPTASLDAVSKVRILALLDELRAERTIILLTHDFSVASALTDRLAVMYSGRLVESGDTTRVIKDPRHPYTRGLLRSFPDMSTTKDLQGIPGKGIEVGEGCPFSPRCSQRIEICRQVLPRLRIIGDREIACHQGGIISLLEVEGLSKHYGAVKALNEASLTLREGETLAVVGETGSGKTTLARCIMGLERPDVGEISLLGQKVKERDKAFYRQVQMVFQHPQECISHRMTVLEAILEPLVIQGIGTREEGIRLANEVISQVELPVDDGFLQQYAHHLSGGELQKIAIARALILNPRLLVADEPTSSLDASVQAKIIRLLLNLQEQRGLALLFITHDIALARKISDRIAVMYQGRVVETGVTSKILSNPRHEHTQELLEAAQALTAG